MTYAIGFLSIQFSPNAASPRRLCQPPWTQPTRKKSRPPFRRNQASRSNPAKRQPLFGREREGGASLREAASLATPASPPRLFRRGSGGGRFSIREVPSPGVPRTPTPVSSDVRRGDGLGGCGALRAWARDRRAAENLPASVDQDIAPLRPRCRCRGQPRKQRSVNVGSRSCKSPLTAGYASMTTVMHRRESAA